MFVKLDAIGDVLRSASLLPAIVKRHEAPYIAWLTRKESVELVGMMKYVDEVIELTETSLARVVTGGWDYVYSISNDLPSASIATMAQSRIPPIGYYVERGAIKASSVAAERWLELAAFDRLKKHNTETYQQRMFDIIGVESPKIGPPRLQISQARRSLAQDRIRTLFPGSSLPRLAINVGAGSRWPKKMLSAEQICRYIHLAHERIGVDILLVGGAAEKDKARAIVRLCGNDHQVKVALTESSIAEFVALLSEADVLLCGDTLAMHVAAAVGLPTVAVFGPTSSSEIADFEGLIQKVWVDDLDCLVCYGDCEKGDNCMSLLSLNLLVDLTESQLARRCGNVPVGKERETT